MEPTHLSTNRYEWSSRIGEVIIDHNSKTFTVQDIAEVFTMETREVKGGTQYIVRDQCGLEWHGASNVLSFAPFVIFSHSCILRGDVDPHLAFAKLIWSL